MSAKRAATSYHGRSKQRGAALMVMLVIMIVGGAALLVSSLSSSSLQMARDKTTAEALAQAKAALIGYAITYNDTHSGQTFGFLPCPDSDASNGEGSSKLSCSSKNISTVGRLPWKTLGLPVLHDGNGECLWYAVAGTYKYNPKTDIMDWDTNGLFQVLASSSVTLAGSTTDSQAVAVVFASGVPLTGQSQNRAPNGNAPLCGGNYTASNYLDSDTTISANNAVPSSVANATSQFFAAGATTNINDHIIFITKDDIFNAIKKRNDFGTFVSTLLSTSTTCLTTTLSAPVTINFSGSSPVETSGGTIVGSLEIGRVPQSCLASPLDNWQDNLLYARCTSGLSCLTVNGASCRGVVLFPGERGSSQTRNTNTDKNTWSNYLENAPSANLTAFTTGGTSFTGATSYSSASTSTDILACIP
jgi:type II secretory pathway pseudopilin PulG